ncbi:LiaF transmembrane domain-containing protein, partial [Petrocella sp. FN5]|uniref:LiaF transmembrane domain-containing protein n=1 Tax=Petrocella sp. FN5 TaxID=3032002 RepID=UPI0023DB0D22
MKKMRVSSSTVFGIILIAVGIISLLSSLGYVESWDLYSTFWPLILILLGIKHLMDYQSSNLFGLILILIGTLFQLDNLDIKYLSNLSVGEMMIPMIIILIGLSFIIPKGEESKKKTD